MKLQTKQFKAAVARRVSKPGARASFPGVRGLCAAAALCGALITSARILIFQIVRRSFAACS